MTDLEALKAIWALKGFERQWDRANEDANQAYKKLYDQYRRRRGREGKPVQLPERSEGLVAQFPNDMLQGLSVALRPLVQSYPDLADLVKTYLDRMGQLIALSHRIFAPPPPPPPAPVPPPPPPQIPPPHPPRVGEIRPWTEQPIQIMQPGPPPVLQQVIARNAEAMAPIEQAQGALVSALSRIGEMTQLLQNNAAQLVTRTEWEAVSGDAYRAETARRTLRDTLTNKIIELITGMERQYNVSPAEGNREPADEQTATFEGAIRTMLNQLEAILQAEFRLERIPIDRNTIFDERCMVVYDQYEEEPPAPNTAGNVARVIEPGYWIKLPNGDAELYRRARVRLYKGKRR